MTHCFTPLKKILLLAGIQLITLAAMAQVKYQSKDNLNLTVAGTSTMHDWTMKSSKGDVSATFVVAANGQITDLSALTFTTPAEALKSEKSGMDKNAYKSLKTSKAPNLTYTLTSATITGNVIKCQGKLTLAGFTKETDLVATLKANADGTLTVTGTKKISMKDYQIDPPSFMMGTIKTGNDITLTFSVTLKK
ncbi:YceI family protein [Filimonas effusa]|nr:YceI family protein [Filimonas effusa]